MHNEVISELETDMSETHEAIRKELSRIRTGRANPNLLDGIRVDYYGSSTPLAQVASISAPEPRLLQIKPWDKTALGPIERAIHEANLGISPQNNGEIIRLAFPALTEDRRKDFVKEAWVVIENGKISLRNKRRDANAMLKSIEKEGELSEDGLRDCLERVQKLTDGHTGKLDELGRSKEAEILEI
jgi:ribosome recycling factor